MEIYTALSIPENNITDSSISINSGTNQTLQQRLQFENDLQLNYDNKKLLAENLNYLNKP